MAPSTCPRHTRACRGWAGVLAALVALVALGPFAAVGAQDRGDAEQPQQADGAVDDGDRRIQVLDADLSGFPDVALVAAVPPALAGELSGDSFGLTENGRFRTVRVEKLRDVIEVVVVVDTSGSMNGEPIAAARRAAGRFVGALDEDTAVSIVGFGATVDVAAPFGSSRAEVTAAIDALSATGETALYDGLVRASRSFRDPDARHFVVVLSDGKDTASSATLADATAAIVDADANLYAVTLESEDADFGGLRSLTNRVEGELVSASNAASLDAAYSSIASRITNQYLVRYASQATDVDAAQVVLSVDAFGILATADRTIDLTDVATVSHGSPTGPSASPTPVSVQVGEPVLAVAPEPGFLQSTLALYVGGFVVFAGIGLALFLTFSIEPSGPSAMQRLNFGRAASGGTKRSGLAAIADRASAVADRVLEKQERRGALDAQLERAGMDMRPGEFVMANIGVALGMGLFGVIMFGTLQALVLLGLGLVGGRLFLKKKAAKRQKKFANQLGDTLMMIAGSLRSGHGIGAAIDTIATQSDSPTCDEFGRAVSESRIGRDMVESLYDIADRTGSEDFVWVVRAISINRELGGDLAEILDNVGETIRDRNRLKDQVSALSAEGKVSALILFVMPIGVAGWVQMTNPAYLAAMTGNTTGKIVVGFAGLMLTVGGLWLKKLVNVQF